MGSSEGRAPGRMAAAAHARDKQRRLSSADATVVLQVGGAGGGHSA